MISIIFPDPSNMLIHRRCIFFFFFFISHYFFFNFTYPVYIDSFILNCQFCTIF